MPVTPVTPAGLVAAVADLVLAQDGRARVAIDGPPPTEPVQLAEQVAERLRTAGRPSIVVAATDFLRPASVRLEYGREDPDELLTGWLDTAALQREVLDPTAPPGSGRLLPCLWNPATDRAYRQPYVTLPDPGAVLVAGTFLLGRGLPFDLTVHLRMGPAALRRLLPDAERWTLPAYERYADHHRPESEADLLAFADHPDRPAIRTHPPRPNPGTSHP